MRDPLRRLAALAITIATLTGCSADRPEVKPGTCLAKETTSSGQRAPDLTSVVPCTSQHRYEVYDVVDLPERQALAGGAQRTCSTSLLRATGYDALKLNGKSAAEAGLVPALRGIEAPKYVVMPEQPQLAGRRQVVCTARTKLLVRAARGDALLLSVAKTSEFPLVLRACRAYDADRRTVGDSRCTNPHVSETLFYFEADKVLGRKFVASIVRDPTAEKFDRFDEVCTQTLPYLLGKGFDYDLRGFGSVARRWTDDNTTVRCDVGPIEFRTMDLPPGSLVGTRGIDVKLSPAQGNRPTVAGSSAV